MLLSELLRPSLIKTNLEAESRREAIGELVDLLVQEHEVSLNSRSEVLNAVLAQEKQHSSGLSQGVAVPHAITDKTEDIICAMGISERGVDFSSSDGSPSRIVVLVLAPKRSYAGEVRTLAGIQHLFSHATLKEQVLQAKDGQAAYSLIEKEEHASALV